MLHLPATVFVPFTWDGRQWVKLDDIPRFLEPQECMTYLSQHPELSTRHIDWQERSERDLIQEYVRGIGTNVRLS